ncbi:lipoprotein-anchoring transpeptidase ErfK/SrfK [Microbacterium terrae]|uniref:L,D-transpeptidase catalytic domain n=1 Tax=Microbacterium terrae TaxID=69369 RepID=A0A0M2H9L5_9MICO|nr:L,D-transpeptidase [Microbacterium terrae]KJL41325.1 L,D-transpeptidase catalytic domain [Microbacterium terrae]MBP1077637.1 lipoprotein-anchoring transpeptidase ErfK/SrfK [Microbacterium terrae]GLJ99242.1 hypothetical protein GCM10017594_24390 [Microbacterium terrae]
MADAGGTGRARPRRAIAIGALAAVVIGVFVALAVSYAERGEPAASAPTPTETGAATATPAEPTPTPTPTPTGYPANTTSYDVTTLPRVTVFSVIPELPVDDDPFAAASGLTALAGAAGAPVFADPTGEPVAYVPREYSYGGTTLPIVEKQDDWVEVLLTGRQAVPSQGDPAQVTGWLRVADVEIAPIDVEVLVDISDRTVDIVRGGVAERIATDFAWGTEDTPTPMGRAFIMMTRVVPEYWYTRGNPIVYLSVQSPTLDGFAGANVAVTAFHYHDDRTGPISNGCIRLGPEPIAALAELPEGTPVTIAP